ncbi:MAG: nucleotidyltransferase domain-containing protein [Promethearchaeia archaeon]
MPILKQKKVLGLLLFGSYANETQTNRSDIDIFIVAPEVNPHDLYSLCSVQIDVFTKRYDLKSFSELPLYIQIKVIQEGIVVYSPDELELFEYFYRFRKLWADQKHRQELTKDELLSLLD